MTFIDETSNEWLGRASIQVVNGVVSATTSGKFALKIGAAHTVRATYDGNATWGGATATYVQNVVARPAGAALNSSANPAVVGQAITLTASVWDLDQDPAAPVPSGTVDFFDGSSFLGSAPLDASGNATLTTADLSAGFRALQVSYAGDDHYAPAEASLTQEVQPANTPPVGGDDNASTDIATPVSISVLANDADPDGDPLTLLSVSPPLHGTALKNDNGTPGDPSDDYIVYTPTQTSPAPMHSPTRSTKATVTSFRYPLPFKWGRWRIRMASPSSTPSVEWCGSTRILTASGRTPTAF